LWPSGLPVCAADEVAQLSALVDAAIGGATGKLEDR